MAPNDPRPLLWEALLLLAARRFDLAADALADLERLDPGDPRLPVLRSRLAEGEGRSEEALRWMEVAVERQPSWQRLYRLAGLELRSGRVEEARATLEQLLRRAPGNGWGRAKLAELELLYGRLERAEEIYLQLVDSEPPTVGRLINLGLVRLLQGRPEAAEESFLRALELSPDHPTVLVNLADVELALGRTDAASARYRAVIAALGDGPLTAAEQMLEAQCLIRLGRREEAVRLTQEALGRAPEDSEVAYLAALVYALAGERTSSLVNARRALERGVRPVWFELAAFDPMRSDPGFRALLAGPAGAR